MYGPWHYIGYHRYWLFSLRCASAHVFANARLLFLQTMSLDAGRAGVSELMTVRARRGGAAREGWAGTPRRVRAQLAAPGYVTLCRDDRK